MSGLLALKMRMRFLIPLSRVCYSRDGVNPLVRYDNLKLCCWVNYVT